MDKIINLLINNWTKGVDTYTHNGSTWLIFTEQKNWVIELTEGKTLWYNYNFFKELFSLASMDVMTNQYYITKWVEDNIIGEVNDTHWGSTLNQLFVGDVIENGVKETELHKGVRPSAVESTIQNGVIMTNPRRYVTNKILDDTIENGVKETYDDSYHHKDRIDGVIKNGVKQTKPIGKESPNYPKVVINNIIQNGTKNPSV